MDIIRCKDCYYHSDDTCNFHDKKVSSEDSCDYGTDCSEVIGILYQMENTKALTYRINFDLK